MTDERSKKRLERFRGSLIRRVQTMTTRLLGRVQGGGAAGDEQEVARELHTLKGDARMLGLGEIADVAHAAEELLIASGAARVDGPRVVTALDRVVAALQGQLGDEATTRDALLVQVALLSAASEPAAPSAAVEVTASESAPDEDKTNWVQVDASYITSLADGLHEFAFALRALHHQTSLQARRKEPESRRVVLERLEALDRLRGQFDDLLEHAWALHLAPLEPMLQELARHARELSVAQGKSVRTNVRCGTIQLERTVCEALWDPLLHLVLNAVDHGIEPADEREQNSKAREAALTISAETLGPNVVIEVWDDGRGVDTSRVRETAVRRNLLTAEEAVALDERGALDLVFMHGFSTRETATQISGRGVGLDVVRTAAERVGGSARVVSDLGQGTRFLLEIPSRIGKERALVVKCAGALYAVPSRNLREIVRVTPPWTDTLRHGPDDLPLVSLDEALGDNANRNAGFALVVEVQNRRWGFAVQNLVGEHELVRRPVSDVLGGSGLVSAGAMLADGRLVMILSSSELARRSGRDGVLPTPIALEPQGSAES